MSTDCADLAATVRVAEAPATLAPAPQRAVALLTEAGPDSALVAALLARGWPVVADPADADAVIVEADGSVAVLLETVEALRLAASGRPVVVVLGDTDALDHALVRDLVGRGVRAVVQASRVEEALAVSVEAALAGQTVLPAALGGAPRRMLTVREKQALGMIVLGFTNREIAGKLYVAESTVKSHLSSAFAKLGVRSRSQAAAAILDPVNGLGTGILEIVGDESQPHSASPASLQP